MKKELKITAWRPLKEIKERHAQFWVIIQPTHEPEIFGRDEDPDHFFCRSGIFKGLSGLDECLGATNCSAEVTLCQIKRKLQK